MVSLTVKSEQDQNIKKKIVFIENKIPHLAVGKYRLTLTQEVSGRGEGGEVKPTDPRPYSVQKRFKVQGERFSYNPGVFDSVFPASNAQGDYRGNFPHIVFTSSSLPWQLSSVIDSTTPGVGLLVFYSGEEPLLKQIEVSQLTKDNAGIFTDHIVLDPDEQGSEAKCSIIEVPVTLFNAIAPTKNDLKYLAHVRQVLLERKSETNIAQKRSRTAGTAATSSSLFGTPQAEGDIAQDFSIVIANRLAPFQGKCTTHLVSLENLWDYLPNSTKNKEFISNTAIRLISLKSWSFEVIPEPKLLSDIINNLNGSYKNTDIPITLTLPSVTAPNDAADQANLKDLNKAFNIGYVPINHQMRAGDTSVSWYRGPFAPYKVGDILNYFDSKPGLNNSYYECADELLRYDPDTGMFDVSYSAAWQLGRLLAIQNKGFAQALYKWKKGFIQATIAKIEEKQFFNNFNNFTTSLLLDKSRIKSSNTNLKRNYIIAEGLIAPVLKTILEPLKTQSNK